MELILAPFLFRAGLIYCCPRFARLSGYDCKSCTAPIPIVTAGTSVTADSGETVVLIANEALLVPGQRTSLLSTMQLRENGVQVNDVAKRHGGRQNIVAKGNTIPIHFHRGLLELPLRVPTEQELSTCRRIILSSDEPWEPSRF